MSRRRTGATAIASNPVLVGVATTLVIVVAVFLAYNANQGLPWVPSYRLTAEVPTAANLVRGNEARIGGLRVGVIDKITPVQKEDGSYASILDLKLETTVRPLPVDSTIIIRPAVGPWPQVRPDHQGHVEQGFADGDRIPLSSYAKTRPVDIDEFYSMFDEPRPALRPRSTRPATAAPSPAAARASTARSRRSCRWPSTPRPCSRTSPASSTHLEDFFKEQGDAARIVAPVAEIQGALFTNLDTHLHGVRRGRAAPTSSSPSARARAASTPPPRCFRGCMPFLENTDQFFTELQPGTRALRASHKDLADGFVTGVTATRRSVALNNRLTGFLRALQRFAKRPGGPDRARAT